MVMTRPSCGAYFYKLGMALIANQLFVAKSDAQSPYKPGRRTSRPMTGRSLIFLPFLPTATTITGHVMLSSASTVRIPMCLSVWQPTWTGNISTPRILAALRFWRSSQWHRAAPTRRRAQKARWHELGARHNFVVAVINERDELVTGTYPIT
jgi:small-conductance mechanosensitive channel